MTSELDERAVERCIVCDTEIKTMCFRGTGVCCETCRKIRDREPTNKPYNAIH